MAGPWDKYRSESKPAAAGPWEKYAPPAATAPQSEPEPSALSRFASGVGKQINPVTMIEGMAQTLTTNPIDTLRGMGEAQDRLRLDAADAFQRGDLVTAGRKALEYLVPVFGPAVSAMGDKAASGDVAGAMGEATGFAAVTAAPGALKGGPSTRGVPKVSEKLYNASLKPSTTLSPAERTAMARTGITERIPVTEGGYAKLNRLVEKVNQEVSNTIAKNPNAPTLPHRAAQKVDPVIDRFKQQVTPASDLAAIQGVRDEFLGRYPLRNPQGQINPQSAYQIPASEAQAMKVGTYRKLKNAYGEVSSAQKEAMKGLARGLKDELQMVFPELKALNAREGKLLALEPELEKAIGRSMNREVVPLRGSMGTVTGMIGSILSIPGLQSRLAIALSEAAKKAPSAAKGVTIGARRAEINARIQEYVTNLESAESLQQPIELPMAAQVTPGESRERLR